MEYEQVIEGICGQADWRIARIGLISELRLQFQCKHYIYILLSQDDKQNELYSAKIMRLLQNLNLKSEDNLYNLVEEYLTTLSPRITLTKEELLKMQNTKTKLPIFYQQAIINDVHKIIIF